MKNYIKIRNSFKVINVKLKAISQFTDYKTTLGGKLKNNK